MAIVCLAENLRDLKQKLGNILIGYNENDNCYKNVNTENLVFEYETPKEAFEKYALQFINDSNRKNKNSCVKYISCNDKVK